jgi:GTPase SAR1 family protein
MVAINYANREVSCKIVYYGPGLSGKTTNLQYIHGKVPNTTRGDLISLATDADRTLPALYGPRTGVLQCYPETGAAGRGWVNICS